MSKKLKKNVPQLRFPEFEGDWNELIISDIGEVIRGASPRPKGDRRYYGGKIPRLMVEDVTRDGKYVTPRTDFLTEEGAKLSRPCEKGTLTIVCSGTVGIPSFLAVDACIHDGFLAIKKLNKEIVNEDFLYHQISTLRNTFESSATHGGVFTNLTTEVLKNFKIKVTSIAEQEKIASFLGAVDTRLNQLRRKRELLQTYKRGVMQKLFSQEIRFRDATSSLFPDWEKKTLGEVLDFKNGINADKSKYGSGKKFINVLDIINENPIYYDTILGSVEITEQEFDNNDVKYGDILFQRSSEIREESGQSNVYLDKNKRATFGGFVIRGRPRMSFNPVYFNYLLKTNFIRKEITDRSGGSTRFNVGQNSLSQVPLFICSSTEEQEKIANFITAIDRKIEALSRKIEQTEQFKKGLLQKLFV